MYSHNVPQTPWGRAAGIGALNPADLASGLLSSATAEAKSVAANAISRARIRTALTPEIVLDFPLRPGAPDPATSAAKNRIGRLVQPAVILESPYLSQPVVMAPYGLPTQDRSVEAAVVGAVGFGLALYGAVTLVRQAVGLVL